MPNLGKLSPRSEMSLGVNPLVDLEAKRRKPPPTGAERERLVERIEQIMKELSAAARQNGLAEEDVDAFIASLDDKSAP